MPCKALPLTVTVVANWVDRSEEIDEDLTMKMTKGKTNNHPCSRRGTNLGF